MMMPLHPLVSRLRSFAGWFWLTPVEWVVLLLIGWLVVRMAWPRYEQWRVGELLRDEQYTVMQVRGALIGPETIQRSCPAVLDTCPDGSTSEECPYFTDLSPAPTTLSGWRKEGEHYVGPAGSWYRYDPRACQFLPVSAPYDTS